MELAQQLEFIYRGGKTKRFHTSDTLTAQTVGEHSFGVAWMIYLVCPTARKEVFLAALAHDLAEHRVGDVPSPVKRSFPVLKMALDAAEGAALGAASLNFEGRLAEGELRLLKYADMLDGMMFCVRERRMGSVVVQEIYNNFHSYAIGIRGLPENAKLLFDVIHNLWEEADDAKIERLPSWGKSL